MKLGLLKVVGILMSLGIIFYEMLEKEVPKHSHKSSLIFSEIIPVSITLIIDKLLNTFPEDRYQSYLGLLDDLQRCQKEIQSTGTISKFFPGITDKPNRLIFTDFLYGRKKEKALLNNIIDDVKGGKFCFLIVNGYSGIGKTMIIENYLKAKFSNKGLFIQGKYEQGFNQPYSGIAAAIKYLVEKNEGIKFSENQMNTLKKEIIFELKQFKKSIYKNALINLLGFIISRKK